MDEIGAMSDESKIYVGEETGGGGTITEIDPATNTVGGTVPNPLGPLTGPMAFPYAFLFTGEQKGLGAIDSGFDGSRNRISNGGSGTNCSAGASPHGRSFMIPVLLILFGLMLVRRR
jgi:MYXO-CTERM domain-containing protein